MNIKKLLLVIIVLVFASCREVKKAEDFSTIEIEGCQYLKAEAIRGYKGYGYFAHKGNCSNLIHRVR
jgi:ABC-type antimicrobial peptide transport system permease subunit